jgi:hypothetical protein
MQDYTPQQYYQSPNYSKAQIIPNKIPMTKSKNL